MLYFTLTVSILHLLWMNWLIYRKADPSLCFFSAIAPFVLNFCMIASLTLFIQPLAMVILVGVQRWGFRDRRLAFTVASVSVVGVLFALGIWIALSTQRELVERYPMESMAQRVPMPKPNKAGSRVSDRKEWTELKERLAEDQEEAAAHLFRNRTDQLRRLHEETTANFIQSPGFGVMRGHRGNVDPSRLEFQPPSDEPIPEMKQAETVFFSTETLQKPYRGNQLDALSQLHFGALRDFVNVRGFGYIKDRQHVAGFYSHQFSRMPESGALSVKRLELVSLLKHNQPAVYVTKELPRMKELANAPTRTLSEFEAMGLESLEKGEDLFVREIDSSIHLLGAIRSVDQCVKCHGGERGALLGAFSYSLRTVWSH